MKVLQELVSIVTRHRIKKIEVISNINNKTKLNKLYSAIESHKINSDEQAFKLLFNEGESIENYYKLKYRFKSRLLNTILVINPTKKTMSSIERAYFQCNRIWTISNILNSFGAVKTSTDLIAKGIREAEKYDFVDYCMLFYNSMAMYAALNIQDRKAFEKYTSKYHFYKEIFDNENEVIQIYCRLMSSYQNLRSLEKNTGLLEESLEKLKTHEISTETIKYIRFYYRSYCLIYLAKQHYEQVIDVCNKAIEKIEQKKFQLTNTKYGYEILLMQCFIQLKEYEKGEIIFKKYENLFPKNSLNWFSLRYYYFILAIHSGNYSQCISIMEDISSNRETSRAASVLAENFQVFEAYVHFLIKIGKIEVEEIKQKQHNRPFRLGRFLNEVPHFSKDKRGLNISILILQVLFLLHDHKYSQIIDRTDALNQYCYRYLRKDETFRSNCFIKMLIKMVEADFNRIRTERYVDPIWKKLQAVPIHVAEQGIEVEIIPYEDLWPMVLEMLD